MSELIRRFKDEYMRTKKALGQHFLTNQHFIDEIVAAAELTADMPVVEIGPGCGVLTAALARHTNRLTAIEIDDNAASFLMANKAEFFPQLQLIHADVLSVDMANIYTITEPITIIGNLPYNLSVKIVEHCTAIKSAGFAIKNADPAPKAKPSTIPQGEGDNYPIRKMIFMFQKEVAARIAATPESGKDYSSLSIFCGYHYDIKKIRDISGGNFWPNASVYSTVLEFTPRPALLAPQEEAAFFAFVYKAFRQKRKTLRNNLKEYQALSAVLAKMGISESVRAEELGLERFIEIFKEIQTF